MWHVMQVCEQCLKGSGPVARTMPSQLQAGVPPLGPQHRLGAVPPNKNKKIKKNVLLIPQMFEILSTEIAFFLLSV